MQWIRRIFFFLLTNLLVVITISALLRLLGVAPYLSRAGMDYQALAVFAAIWGMAGAFISLALSKVMAKWMMGVKIIPENTPSHAFQWVRQTVREKATMAGLPMPEVGIFESPEVNAFATGPTKNSSLVALSTGLLNSMSKEEIEGVIAHEVAHIANGDMVTMTLIQGIVNAFTMFLSRAIAYGLSMAVSRDDDGPDWVYYLTQFVLEIAFTMLGWMVVAYFSRLREYRADAGGARLAGRNNMIAALQRLKAAYPVVDPRGQQPAFQAMKISGHGTGLARLFSTHPSLDARIQRLVDEAR